MEGHRLLQESTKRNVRHSKSIQKILDSDFTPFDEVLTPFQTGSRSRTTANFRLSDFYKNGGKTKIPA